MTKQILAVRAPTQERSQQSLERMLEAAEQLIREKGFDALTIGDLVRKARTSVGSFYARFEDKSALLRAVQDRVMNRIEAAFEDRLRVPERPATLEDAIHELVASFGARVAGDTPLVRAFYGQAAIDPAMHVRAARMDRKHFRFFREMLRPHVQEMRHPNPERAILFAFRVYLAITMSLGFGEGAAGPQLRSAIEELTRALLAYFEYEKAAKPRPRRGR